MTASQSLFRAHVPDDKIGMAYLKEICVGAIRHYHAEKNLDGNQFVLL